MKIKIAEVGGKHGLKSAYALQKALDCSPTMASRLWKGNFKQIGIETIEKLCELFKCSPGDLFVYERDLPVADGVRTALRIQTHLTKIADAARAVSELVKGNSANLPNIESSNDAQSDDTELSKTENAPVTVPKVQKAADGMLSTLEVAERLGLSRKSVNDYIIDGKLRATKGKQGHNFVSEADFIVFRDSRNV
jgi:DNA-binding Xre family transcriptional regulator